MSDYAKIDDVFSIPEEEHGLDRPAADEIFTRTIEIFATPVPINTNSNGDQDAVHDGSEEPIDHSQWDIENVLGDFTEQLKQAEGEGSAAEQTSSPGTDPHYFPNGIPNPEPMRNDTHKDEAGDHPEDFSDIQTMLAQAEQPDPALARHNGAAIETTERTIYLRLVSEKAAIQYSFLQNPEYRGRNGALMHRLDAALSLLEEIISSGTTLQQATRDFADLDQEILQRIHSQVSRQRANAEQTQQPLDNQTRATAQLPPLKICIGEELRLKLLKASVLADINSFV
jgi:hypothetical protein